MKDMHIARESHLPPIGMRIVKSAVGVFLCFVIYFLRGKDGIPFYSALAVLWCIQPYTKNTFLNALQRTIGTGIGAAYGLLFILLELKVFHFDDNLLHYLLLSFFIVPVIYTTVLCNKKNASYFSCVVYLSIVVNHLGDANPYLFVLDRVCDTMIGISLGLFLNLIRIPRRKRTDTLFVSGLDEVILNPHNTLSPHNKTELNRMISDGMHFTIATMRTPASMIEPLRDLDLKLPVIAMDGAVLYDTKTHHYEKVVYIPAVEAQELYTFLRGRGFHVFTNIIIEDLLLILYGDFTNDAERALFSSLHSSLYRNYVKGEPPVDRDVVYFTLLDRTERTQALYEELEKMGLTERYKILHTPSDDQPGFSYMKIYNKAADRYHMIRFLMEELSLDKLERFGTDPAQCDITVKNQDPNHIIRLLKNHFAPPLWKREP